MHGLSWNDEDAKRLRAMWAENASTPAIAAALSRTEDGITNKARALGLGHRELSRWTPEMDSVLRADFTAGVSFGEIAKKLNVSRSAAIGRGDRLGLSRNKPTLRSPLGSPEGPTDGRRLSNVVTFRPRAIHAATDSPPLPGSRPRPWIERDVKGGPRLCCWPVDVPGAEVQHSCCMPRSMGHKSYCAAHADLSVGRVSANDFAPAASSQTIFVGGDENTSRAGYSEQNQSGEAVRKHQPHPGKLQTTEV